MRNQEIDSLKQGDLGESGLMHTERVNTEVELGAPISQRDLPPAKTDLQKHKCVRRDGPFGRRRRELQGPVEIGDIDRMHGLALTGLRKNAESGGEGIARKAARTDPKVLAGIQKYLGEQRHKVV